MLSKNACLEDRRASLSAASVPPENSMDKACKGIFDRVDSTLRYDQ